MRHMAHFKLGTTSRIPFILYANKTAPALLTDEDRLNKCPKSCSIKKTLLSSTFPFLLVGDKFSSFSVSLSHIVHTPLPFITINLTPPLWGRWLLSLVRFPYFLSHSCFSSWQSLSSRYTASFLPSWQVKVLVPSPSSSSYSYPHIRITRVLEKMLILARAHSQPMKSELLGVDVSISTFLNFQVIPRCS